MRSPVLAIDLFKRIVSSEVLKEIWLEAINNDDAVWVYKQTPWLKTINKNKFSSILIYKMLAVKLRITALQHVPTEAAVGSVSLRKSIEDAREHFRKAFGKAPPCYDIISRFIARFLIAGTAHFRRMSENFLNIVSRLGEWVAGDEKLLHFTGNSGDIRLVVSKPDRVGLWFYELSARLSNGRPYLLYMRMHESDPSRGRSIMTKEIVMDWANIVSRNDDQFMHNPSTILVMDSYYLTENARDELLQKELKFIAAIQGNRFKSLFEQINPKVERPGQWEGIYHRATHQLLVLHDDKALVGGGNKRKLVLTNAFERKVKRPKYKNIIPAYTAYGKMFNVCDRFNRSLHDRTWPHKHGGRDCCGDLGHQDTFAWAAIMQNVYNAFLSINNESAEDYNFQTFFLDLADDLYSEMSGFD